MSQAKLAEHVTLCETLDRVLNKGVALHGDIMISVSGVDLLTIRLRALVCSSDKIATRPMVSVSGIDADQETA